MRKTILFGIAVFMGLVVGSTSSQAQEIDLGKYSDFTPFQENWLKTEPQNPSRDWLISYGGRLYDNWFDSLLQWTPVSTHPSYPKAGKQKGPDTWRCKECHGWDYKGKDGVYGDPKSSHFTGIKGIDGYVGKNPRDVIKILRDDTHKYDQRKLPKFAAERLALFVTEGQVDISAFVKTPKKVKGDTEKGLNIFQNLCAVCHGFDGKAINFGNSSSPEFVGTVAVDNPWELFHKVLNGYPGSIMTSQRWVPLKFLSDVAAYAQTLPTK